MTTYNPVALSTYIPKPLCCGNCFSKQFSDYGLYKCKRTGEAICEREAYTATYHAGGGNCRNGSWSKKYKQTRYSPINWAQKEYCAHYFDERMHLILQIRKAADLYDLEKVGLKIKEVYKDMEARYAVVLGQLRAEYRLRLDYLKSLDTGANLYSVPTLDMAQIKAKLENCAEEEVKPLKEALAALEAFARQSTFINGRVNVQSATLYFTDLRNQERTAKWEIWGANPGKPQIALIQYDDECDRQIATAEDMLSRGFDPRTGEAI